MPKNDGYVAEKKNESVFTSNDILPEILSFLPIQTVVSVCTNVNTFFNKMSGVALECHSDFRLVEEGVKNKTTAQLILQKPELYKKLEGPAQSNNFLRLGLAHDNIAKIIIQTPILAIYLSEEDKKTLHEKAFPSPLRIRAGHSGHACCW